MAFQLIGVIVTLLAVFGVLVSTIGYVNFTNSIKNEYSVTTFHMADTAATLVNGDHLDEYLDGKYQDEYRLTRSYLDGYCRRMWVSLIYVISVDTSDYGRFVSVFNSVNNSVDNSEYKEWELGHRTIPPYLLRMLAYTLAYRTLPKKEQKSSGKKKEK